MYAIAAFGLVMVAISLVMVANPEAWGKMILSFVRVPYFHPIEIALRVVFGLLFIAYADQSKFPLTIEIMGFILLGVGVGLLLTPPSYHRRFARWSVEKVSRYFRPAGLISLAFGIFLIYAAI